ncbi:MAG: response regulator transcription factor [Paramuribaculum sp.]|nr:response regulator transcription factor [Paramuribaculum sp.]
MDTKKRILVVDDEEALREALAFNIESEGYDVDTAGSAEEALIMDIASYNLILLDIMMGEISGTQFAKIIKSNPKLAHIPIIFCTAKDSEDDMIAGLDLGADDYIMKPYSLRGVLARIRTVLRRTTSATAPHKQPQTVGYKGLVLYTDTRRCTLNGAEVSLPRKEYEILLKLMTNRERIFSRAELLKEIWTDEVVVLDRVVDVNITRIRQKIGEYGRNIVTRSGYGYGFFE